MREVKHTALTKPEANRQERPLAAMRWPIELKHAIVVTKRVTVPEKYANDMEDVASIFGQAAYPGGERKGGPSRCSAYDSRKQHKAGTSLPVRVHRRLAS